MKDLALQVVARITTMILVVVMLRAMVITRMALTCSATEYQFRPGCFVHDTQLSETTREMSSCYGDRCGCSPREATETSYLDPRLLTTEGSSESKLQYLSANRHSVLQVDSMLEAAGESQSHQNNWDILPYPCFSPNSRVGMTASTLSSSSDRSPRYEEVLQPILTVSEERQLRRKAQNREA